MGTRSANGASRLGHHAYPGQLANFVDQDRSTVRQLTISEGEGCGLEREIEGRVYPDQTATAHHRKLATVLVKKGLLATIEKCGFLGCWKHALGSGRTAIPSTKRVARCAANARGMSDCAARACRVPQEDRCPESSSWRCLECFRSWAPPALTELSGALGGLPACG